MEVCLTKTCSWRKSSSPLWYRSPGRGFIAHIHCAPTRFSMRMSASVNFSGEKGEEEDAEGEEGEEEEEEEEEEEDSEGSAGL
jgi:hypothetical protein